MAATAVDHEHRVTARELFFDLVFVFAFTQVATLLAGEPTFAGIGRSVLVLAALWWVWSAYAWLMNTVDPEEGVVGAALLAALIAMFVAPLAVPGVFDGDGVLFGAAFLVVCAMHSVLYALAGRGNRDLLGAMLRLTPWTLLGAALILAASFADSARTWLWIAALAITFVAAVLSGSTGLARVPVALRGTPRPRADHRARLAAALLLLLLLPIATIVSALAALALVTAVWLALHMDELLWWREARAETRSMLTSS
jgi:low temperature requirement protein LtrA